MSVLEAMDEVIERVVESFEKDSEFNYEFTGESHVLTCDVHTVTITAEVEENADEWEIYAEVKDSAGDQVDTFFDSGDSLAEITSGRFEAIFETFLADNILHPYFPIID